MTSVKFINLDGDRPWPGVLPPGVNGPCLATFLYKIANIGQGRPAHLNTGGLSRQSWSLQADVLDTCSFKCMRGVCVCVCVCGGGGGGGGGHS